MDNDRGQLYLMFWCPPDRAPKFETSYLEEYGKVFATEVRIEGFEYVGRGVSATPAGSKNNAAIHYLMHLIQDGKLDKEAVAKKVPCLPLGIHPDGTFDPSPLPRFLEPVTDKSFYKHGISPGNDSHGMTIAHSSVSNQQGTGGVLSSLQERQGFNAKNRDPRLRSSVQYVPLQILVPKQAIQNVIGADGSVIKRIETNNGVKITFPGKNKNNDLEDGIFTLVGESDKVQAAALTINKIIQWSLVRAANSLQQAVVSHDQNSSSTIHIEPPGTYNSAAVNSRTVESTQQKISNIPTTYQQAQGSVTSIAPTDITKMKISIPQELVGLAIGTGGVNRKRIESETGVVLNFAQKLDDNGCKTCEVIGTSESIAAAVKKINFIIRGNDQNTGSLPSTSQQIEGSVAAPKAVSSRKLSVPKEFVGLVIGQRGANVKRIKEATGVTSIQFDKIADEKGYKTCEISGTAESIEAAVKEINCVIGIKDQSTGSLPSTSQQIEESVAAPKTVSSGKKDTEEATAVLSQENKKSVEIPIPEEVFEFVTGKQNATINHIATKAGVTVSILNKNITDNAGIRKCVISGKSDGVESAAKRVNALINIGVRNAKSTSSLTEHVPTSQSVQTNTVPQHVNTFSQLEWNAISSLLVCAQTPQAMQLKPVLQNVNTSSKLEVTKIIPPASQPPSILPTSIIGQVSQLESKAPMPQENVHRMNIIDELQQKLLKSQEKSKTVLPKPQRNWYRMAVSSSHIQSFKGYDFVLEPSLEREIDNVLAAMNIPPKKIVGNSAFSLKPKLNVSPWKTSTSQPDIVMRWWSPPQKNWDPWLNKNIDEPPLSEMSLEQISSHLTTAHFSQIQNDEKLQNNIKERKKACVQLLQHEILHRIKTNPVTIIHGPSGCGKSTQIPQYIFDSYLSLECAAECCILVTQPRDITVISTAKHVAKGRCEEMGNSIGYEVAFQSCYPRPYGCILYCTLDVLLKRLEAGIRGVSHIILDDIHERSAKLEFVLAILRDLIKAFPNLRIILMSATMDLNPLKQYFPSCTVVDVPLKTHAVKDYYLEDIVQLLGFVPPQEKSIEETEYCDNLDEKEDIKYYESINYNFYTNGSIIKGTLFEIIMELLKYIKSLNVKGSVLVFLPDCNTISTLMRHLLNHSAFDNSSYLFVPLHPEISPEQVEDVFNPAPSEVTKVILSTDIAETAITPRDVAYVIDSCKTVIRKFSSSSKSVNYTIVLATKYNLEQRRRQASFFQPGFCFHLCSRDCYNKLKNDIVPEAQYTSLHEIILSIKLLRLGNSKQFLSRTLKPPSSKAILDAEELLDELGALGKNGNLTPLGKILARLPVDPQLGKMIVLGCLFSLGDISCLLAAHHSVHPESPATNLEKFIGYRCSDHIAFVNSFIQWQMMKTKDVNEKEEFFHKHNLPIHSLELIYDMKTQLREILKSMGFPDDCLAEKPLFLADHDSDVDMVIALLVMGLYPNISFHKESKSASEHRTDFATSFNSPFFVFGRKICTEEATYKNMTMISVVHLLLFGSRNIKLLNGIIEVDSWINLKMDPQLVSKIVAVRSALEIIINDVAANPKSVDSLSKTHHRLLSVTKALCTEIADDQDSIVPDTVDMEPPSKFRLLDAESWNNSDTWRKDYQLDDSFHNQNVRLFGSNMPVYDKPSDPRLISTDKYRSSDGHYNKAPDPRLITVGKYGSNNGNYEVNLMTQQKEENRTIFQSHEELSRGKAVPESRDKSDLGYWGHGL